MLCLATCVAFGQKSSARLSMPSPVSQLWLGGLPLDLQATELSAATLPSAGSCVLFSRAQLVAIASWPPAPLTALRAPGTSPAGPGC